MLNVALIDQSDTRKAFNKPTPGDISPAAAIAASPAPAGAEPSLDSARRSFCDDDHYAVIDINMHDKGAAALQRRALAGDFPRTATTRPKRGHGYAFYKLPQGAVVQSGGIALDVGLTLKCAAGSSLSARRYTWASDRPVAAAPQWLIELISSGTHPSQHTTDNTAPAAPAAATAPCINSNQTDDNNMQARDASDNEAPAQAAAKSDNIVPFSAPPVADTRLALSFLEFLDMLGVGARHDLFAIHPTLPDKARGKTEAATFLPNEHDDLSSWIDAQRGNRNVYVSINEGREIESVDCRLSRADIGAVRAIAVDLDPEKLPKGTGDPTGAHFRSERARLLNVVKTICEDPLYPPSLVVDSGGGYWLLWLLDKRVAVTPEVLALAEGISRALASRFGGDSVTFDLSRVMRLPGTVNIPDAGKAKQGRTPTLSTIPAEFISNKRYTLDQLAELAPPTPEKSNPKDAPKEPIDWDDVQADTYEELPAMLREKFEALRARHQPLDALWGRVPLRNQNDESASGFEWALAGQLRYFGTFTSTEFAQLRGVWEHRSEKSDGSQRLVQRAWDRNRASVGSNGFEMEEIDESRAPPKLKAAKVEAAKTEAAKPSAPLGGMATPLRRFDPATLPPVPWVVRGLAARRAISTLTGPGGMSKSTWTLILAVAAASGRSDISGYPMTKQECVWVWSQEDDIDQMELRVAAIMQAFGVSHDDMLDANGKHMLYLNSGLGKGKRLNLAKRAGERIIDGEHLAELMASAQAIGASLIILDPLITLHQAPENDNVQMRAVFDLIGQIAVEANCAVLIVSHTGKPDKASSKGFAGDAYASRGASAQPDAGRANVTFMGMSEGDTKAWRIPESTSHLDYVRIDDAKFNLGKKRREPRWFKREEVVVRGFIGDSMEVLRPVELEPVISAGRPDLLEAVAKAIADNLPAGVPHSITTIAAHMPAGMAAAMNNKNRARTINEAFGGEGVNECLTNSGKLSRAVGGGNKGALFTLLLTPQNTL